MFGVRAVPFVLSDCQGPPLPVALNIPIHCTSEPGAVHLPSPLSSHARTIIIYVEYALAFQAHYCHFVALTRPPYMPSTKKGRALTADRYTPGLPLALPATYTQLVVCGDD